MNPQVHALTQRLDHVVTLADRLAADDELSAQYACHLCVLVSGYVEESFRVLLMAYATARSNSEITRFVRLNSQELTNFKFGKFCSILEMFSLEWRKRFESLVGDAEEDALNSVVANRHLIAHGKSTNISLGRVLKYYALLKPTVRTLEEKVIK